MRLSSRSRTTLGLVAAPLPLAILFLIFVPPPEESSLGTWAISSLILLYPFVLIPMGLAKGALLLLSRTSLTAHVVAMFLITFVPMLSIYFFVDFIPDARFSLDVNDSETVNAEFSVAGVLIALFCGLVNALLMAVYWRIAVRGSNDAPDTA